MQVPFLPLRLHMSFRTLPEVLAAVDKVSDDPNIQDALLGKREGAPRYQPPHQRGQRVAVAAAAAGGIGR
ncbi:hypothetical protein N8D56_03760 [Devosia sp. A8/3-2]|nr:hypothetical protein N8D56_03760 [Devosia sp. A8/3-2]